MHSVSPALIAAAALAVVPACSRTPPPSGDPQASAKADAAQALSAAVPALAVPERATNCTRPRSPGCLAFATPDDAFRWVLRKEPAILAVGEAHAQRGTENIASSTKRFTDGFLPILAQGASDIVVELWAPDAKCMKEVKQVASAQKPITEAQASTNQNEYVTLGTKAKASGMTPWLLRPTCDDFSMLADAGADAVGAMLGLVKSLTQTKLTQLYQRNHGPDAGPRPKTVVAYGGALHNDLFPPEETKEYSFGPELDRLSGGLYVELDLIVPEFVKKTPVWDKLPWYASFEAERAEGRFQDKALVYVVNDRSFVLVFPTTPPAK